MRSFFSVKPVSGYKAGYPTKGFFRKSMVKFTHIKLFSFLIIGLLFFISVPGCGEGEQVVKHDGVPEADFDVVNDNETNDVDELAGLPVVDELGIPDSDSEVADFEPSDFDQIDGGAIPECIEDADCAENYYCDLNTNTCVEKLLGDAVPECLINEDCAEGYYCDTTSYTCVEQLSGDPVPDQIVVDDDVSVTDSELSDADTIIDSDPITDSEVPDEALSGIAPPEMKI